MSGIYYFYQEKTLLKMLSANRSVLWYRGLRAVMLGGMLSLVWGRGYGMGEALVLTFSTATTPEICGNGQGTATVTVLNDVGPFEFSIDGGATWQASGTFSNLTQGVYTVMAYEVANPANSGSVGVTITNIAGPTAFLQPFPATCVNNDGEIDVTTLTGTPPFQYQLDNGSFGPGNLIGGVSGGNHSVTIKDNNGCMVTEFTNVPLTNNLTLTMGPGATICQGSSSMLTLMSNATAYSWAPAASLNNPSVAQPSASPQSTTTYTVTATLGVCTTTGPETITVLPAPHPTATPVAQLCYGQSTQLQGAGGVTYQWSPATYLNSTTVPNPVVTAPQKSITYSLNVTDAAGCSSLQPALVLVVVTPPPVVFAGDDTAILLGQTLQLDAVDVNGAGFTSYSWSPAIGLDNPSIQDPVATVTGDMTYVVTASTVAGCTGTDTIRIKAVTASDVVVPNAFSPNGDGRNDILRPHAIGIKDFKYFRVFNRWGQMVFSTTNEGEGWDGRVAGQVQPLGTYVWVVMGLDFAGKPVERRGTVVLVR
ncbi:MAG TPA: gliding motility-associated C-terminal domain-containing protein [Puia sp.]|nr:gliding motility-associated C-terminal domain-containing protein [Puia sp.]